MALTPLPVPSVPVLLFGSFSVMSCSAAQVLLVTPGPPPALCEGDLTPPLTQPVLGNVTFVLSGGMAGWPSGVGGESVSWASSEAVTPGLERVSCRVGLLPPGWRELRPRGVGTWGFREQCR